MAGVEYSRVEAKGLARWDGSGASEAGEVRQKGWGL